MRTYRLTVAGQPLELQATAPNRAATKALRPHAVGTVAIVQGARQGVRRRYRKGARGVVRSGGRVMITRDQTSTPPEARP